MFTGWRMGNDMEWFNNTERLTLKPEWMEILGSQSAIYNIRVSKAQYIYNLIARRGCTKHVQRNTGRYLVFCILVLSLLLYSIGSGITFIIFATFTLLLGWGDRDFLY